MVDKEKITYIFMLQEILAIYQQGICRCVLMSWTLMTTHRFSQKLNIFRI